MVGLRDGLRPLQRRAAADVARLPSVRAGASQALHVVDGAVGELANGYPVFAADRTRGGREPRAVAVIMPLQMPHCS